MDVMDVMDGWMDGSKWSCNSEFHALSDHQIDR